MVYYYENNYGLQKYDTTAIVKLQGCEIWL